MTEKTVSIKTSFIRLDALLKFAGMAQTGGEAKLYIQDGEVSVNGEISHMRGKKCWPGDKIDIFHVTIVVTGGQ